MLATVAQRRESRQSSDNPIWSDPSGVGPMGAIAGAGWALQGARMWSQVGLPSEPWTDQ